MDNPNELQQGWVEKLYGQTGGARIPRTDLRNALGSRNGSKRDVGSRELPVRELAFAAAETCAGLDLNQINLDDRGGGICLGENEIIAVPLVRLRFSSSPAF